ncbi:MAG: YgaP family membrane protein, partial [Sulfurihydrogenibium sp.]
MALWDILVRVLVGSILVYFGVEKGGVFMIATFVGLVLLLTAITGFCPLY